MTVYAAGKKGISTNDLSVEAVDFKPLFDAILKRVPPPEVELDAPLQMLVTTLQWSDYVGRIGVGRIVAGKIKKNQRIALLKHDGRRIDMPVKMLYTFDRMGRTETDEVSAGDLCAVVGVDNGRHRRHDRGYRTRGGNCRSTEDRRADAEDGNPHQRLRRSSGRKGPRSASLAVANERLMTASKLNAFPQRVHAC